ncbi:hypothetical protein O3P69_013856 [Scylla paramamosain]|uniref:Uncharacterized protein n=1 Tax=Scylla paramamosain TaxID=85552 RepID=A0AAW0SQ44_SCYPA
MYFFTPQIILACLAAVAVAAPQFSSEPRRPIIQVLRYTSADDGNGNFNYEYEGENGIYKNVVGTPGSAGQSNMRGVFRFPLDDGIVAEVTFTADENGYRAESPIIPAMPAHALEQIRIAEEQRARGITFDQQGRRINP